MTGKHGWSAANQTLLMLRSITKRLLNQARSGDVIEVYAADWSVEQLREPAQRRSNRRTDTGNMTVTYAVFVNWPTWSSPRS